MRPELEQFRLGVQKAREAIENAIGKSVKIVNKLLLTLKVLFRVTSKKRMNVSESKFRRLN